jgi:thiamine biosynthesis lipoprotein
MGLDEVLVNTGEFHAVGDDPRGGPWAVGLRAGDRILSDKIALSDRALASSSARGICFDAAGEVGHILDPLTGVPAAPRWQLVSVTAPRAWLADGLSTAFCLMDRPSIEAALEALPGARLAALVES